MRHLKYLAIGTMAWAVGGGVMVAIVWSGERLWSLYVNEYFIEVNQVLLGIAAIASVWVVGFSLHSTYTEVRK